MDLPALVPKKRSREFDAYSLPIRARVVRAWLFDGMSTRAIDERIIGIDSSLSLGYQAMGILHHLGLKEPYKGLFHGKSKDEVVLLMQAAGEDFARVLAHLMDDGEVELSALQRKEEEDVAVATRDSADARRRRIAAANVKPERIAVFGFAYKRNPDVVAEALLRAAGTCERCGKPAPFLRARDGTPYLEVHHLVSLSAGGDDSLRNVTAICPNCHREIHHG